MCKGLTQQSNKILAMLWFQQFLKEDLKTSD